MKNIFVALSLMMGVSSARAAENSLLRLPFWPENEWIFQLYYLKQFGLAEGERQ